MFDEKERGEKTTGLRVLALMEICEPPSKEQISGGTTEGKKTGVDGSSGLWIELLSPDHNTGATISKECTSYCEQTP